MKNKIFSIRNIVIGVLIILIDIVVYISLGIAMMDYDDFYEESKGEYMSLESMNMFQKIIFIGMNIWNILNLLFILFIIYNLIKYLRSKI